MFFIICFLSFTYHIHLRPAYRRSLFRGNFYVSCEASSPFSINGVQSVKLLFNNSQLFLNFLKYIRCPRIDVFQSQAFSFQFITQVSTMHKPICFNAHQHFGLFAAKTLGVYNALLIYFASISCAPNPMFCEASESCIGNTPFFWYLLIPAFTFQESTRSI